MNFFTARSSTRFSIGMFAMVVASLAMRYIKPGPSLSENMADFLVGWLYGIAIALLGVALVLQKRSEQQTSEQR